MAHNTRHALITGSSRGIGRGIALKLAESGVRVAIHYYQNEAAALDTLHTAAPLGFPGGEIRGFLVAPEPGTLLLLSTGFAGLAGIAWRRHHRK